MTTNHLENLNALEDSLWAAADNLPANSKLSSSEYCMPVLGVIFPSWPVRRARFVVTNSARKSPQYIIHLVCARQRE